MHALGQLINERMEHPDNRWSLTDVVNRMNAAGHYGIGKSRLGQLRSNPLESIKKDVIFALADGLGVTPLTVANAALESMDIQTRPAEITDSIATINIDPTLGAAQRRQLVALIREMRESAQVITGVAFTDNGDAIPVVGRARSSESKDEVGLRLAEVSEDSIVTETGPPGVEAPDADDVGDVTPDGSPPSQGEYDDDADAFDRLVQASLPGHYATMFNRARAQWSHESLVEDAQRRLAMYGQGDAPRDVVIEPEIADSLYIQYQAVRLAYPVRGGPILHAALLLTNEQYLAAERRFNREFSEMVVSKGHIRTAGAPSFEQYTDPKLLAEADAARRQMFLDLQSPSVDPVLAPTAALDETEDVSDLIAKLEDSGKAREEGDPEVRAAARTAPPGYTGEGRARRDAQDRAGEAIQDDSGMES